MGYNNEEIFLKGLSSKDLILVLTHPLIDSHVISILPIFHGKPSKDSIGDNM